MAVPESLPPSVLVTGGAGFVGSHVCKALRRAGLRPITYDDLSGGHRWAVQWGPLEVGSITDAGRLDQVFRQYRPVGVIHLAGVIAVGESMVEPGLYYESNLGGTLALLQAMRRHRVDRIVFSSSAAVYGEPKSVLVSEDHPQSPVSPYGASKAMGERVIQDFCAAYGMRAMALRYFNAAGADPDGEIGEAHPNETHLIPRILDVADGREPAVTLYGDDYPTRDGSCIRDYVHVSDLAEAHLLALRFLDTHPGSHALNLGNGAGVSVLEVIASVRRVTRRPIDIVVKPRRPGDPPVLVADASRAQKLLGWQPIHDDLDTLIETAWNWREIASSLDATVVPSLEIR